MDSRTMGQIDKLKQRVYDYNMALPKHNLCGWNLHPRLVIAITMLCCFTACGSEKPDTVQKRELLYENRLADRAALDGWVMEGPGELKFDNGWMYMFSPQEKMHHVFWCPIEFPDRFVAEWEVQNMETDTGLCIVFFAASGINGEDIFDPRLPKRDGTFAQYTKGEINSYHISYYANSAHNPGRGHANLRKNNMFALVQEGEDGIPTKSEKIHKIQLVKNGAHIKMFVDGRKIIDWIDDGKQYGKPYVNGKIGFRQMKWTHFRYRNFKVWGLK